MTAQECCDALKALGFRVLVDYIGSAPVILALPPPELVAKRGAEAMRAGAAMLETHAAEMREIAGMTREQVLVGMAEQNPSRGQA